MNLTIRPIQAEDYPYLDLFLYHAIFVPENAQPPAREITLRPELQVYVANFGLMPDDLGVVAEVNGRICGVAWARIINDYGHLDDSTPSIAISLLPEYRGRGIGSRLLKSLLEALKEAGYSQVSLAVQKANFAVRMYRKAGFSVVEEREEEYLMVCKLR